MVVTLGRGSRSLKELENSSKVSFSGPIATNASVAYRQSIDIESI
jgi:hypothetical protein